MFRKLIPYIISSACLLMILVSNAQAQLTLANGYATGSWYNPARDGEGFYIEVVGEDDNLLISVAMYSYDEVGNQLWLVGSAPITATDVGASIPVILVEGPVWGTNYNPADQDTTQFGTIVVQFPTCDTAFFNVNSNVAGLESGSYSLVRLTEIVGMDCVEPPPPAPPPDEPTGITPGLWATEGVCFFVNAEGTKIVESDQCDQGKAVSANVAGIKVELDGRPEEDYSCTANVVCDGAWDITLWTDENYGFQLPQAVCLNEVGGIARIRFTSDSSAAVILIENQGLDGGFCYADGDADGRESGIIATPQ